MDHLSSSQINLYLLCSLKYKFQYVDKLPKPFKSSGLVFGSAFHSTLSWYFKKKLKDNGNGNGIPLENIYRILDADWYAQTVDQEIRYKEGETEMKLLVMAKELLGLYVSQPFKEIMGTEIPFTIPLVNPATGEALGINLEGYIDLVEKDETIVEFKTTNKAMDQGDADDHIQLTAYSYAYEMIHQRPPKNLKIVNFVKTKKPKINPFETQRKQSDYQRFYYLAGQVLKGILNKIFFPKASFICKDCEYGEPCRAWQGA
jgi:putative RecB family exonuclease